MEPTSRDPTLRTIDQRIYRVFWVVAFLTGILIPSFYDWTGSDQSRSSPWVLYAFVAIIIGLLVFWSALIGSHIAKVQGFSPPLSTRQLTIKHFLMATVAMAAYLVAWLAQPMLAGGMLLSGTLFFSMWLVVRVPEMRWPMAGLLCCGYFPFLWVLGRATMRSQLLMFVPSLPAFLPTELIARIVGRHSEQMTWLSMILTSVEILIGIGLIRVSPKLALAYCGLVLAISTVASFGLNALVRM